MAPEGTPPPPQTIHILTSHSLLMLMPDHTVRKIGASMWFYHISHFYFVT